METALVQLLADGIGMGRYPNQDRSPNDVAALAVSLAYLARTEEMTLTPNDVERELVIRTDFGRVAQAFPVDETKFHDRPTFRGELRERATAGQLQLVVGQPGAGKSWELTKLAEELAEDGVLVARHYCYLEPGDELVEQRITTNTLWGNLLAELLDADPSLFETGGTRYSAGLDELEQKLEAAVHPDRPVVLIVDGLDHIARVRAESNSLSDDDVDIVERLATLEIPNGVGLVIGSQPGEHLAPLQTRWGDRLIGRELPPWAPDDITSLALRHGVDAKLNAVGITKEDEHHRIFGIIVERADGNPLYARYLSHGLARGLEDGSIANPVDWLEENPALSGDIASYYDHLYRRASREAKGIADVIGVIDFSVTEDELEDIFPAFERRHLPPALINLRPILEIKQGQGGIRIFHESFRRFIREELRRQERSLADALEPVIIWLNGLGFFEEARSYRFLLPALRRAGRGDEVLALVPPTFVSDSLSYAYPLETIERNIALAADIAASTQNWPMMVRCAELHRSAYTAFDSIQGLHWKEYWSAYLELFGVDAFAERLLFDGRPIRERYDGLLACQLIDDAGGTAPWDEYLSIKDDTDHRVPHDQFDNRGFLGEGEQVSLAVIQGCLRLGEIQIIGKIIKHLRQLDEDFRPLYVQRIGSRLARMHSTEIVERVASLADRETPEGDRILPPKVASVLRLGLVDEYLRLGRVDAAAETANSAVEFIDDPELVALCLKNGASVNSCLEHALAPESPDIAVEEELLHNADGVRAWASSVRILAHDPENGAAILEAERQRVEGVGWYRCWLRFVLGLASTEAARRRGGPGDIVGAFQALTRDMHPFTGKPSASELYTIRRVIHETFELGLSLLETEEQWDQAFEILQRVNEETGSRFDREDGGPLELGTTLELLLPYVSVPAFSAQVLRAMERLAERGERMGTYYSSHADFMLQLAGARQCAGETVSAREAWKTASQYLAAYGFRKDVTLFDLIESAPSVEALGKCQPLLSSVTFHTDGRETRNTPNAWFRRLLELSPNQAVGLLAQTAIEGDGIDSWILGDAIKDAAKKILDEVDPVLIDALLSSVKIEIAHEGAGKKSIDLRLAPIVKLATEHQGLPSGIVDRASAEIQNDIRTHLAEAVARLKETSEEVGLDVTYTELEARSTPGDGRRFTSRTRRRDHTSIHHNLIFPKDANLIELISGLRRANHHYNYDDPHAWDDVVLSLGYSLGFMAEAGQEDDAKRVLRFLARDVDTYLTKAPHPLSRLAQSLDNAGFESLATVAYTLACTSTRGGGGWLNFGDSTHGDLLDRAIGLDRDLTFKTLADEIGHALRASWYQPEAKDLMLFVRHALQDRVGQLGCIPGFFTMSDKALTDIAARLKPEFFGESELLQQEKMPLDGVRFVMEGMVETYRHNVNGWVGTIRVAGPGSCLGEEGVLQDDPAINSVESLDKTFTFHLTLEDIRELTMLHPQLGLVLLNLANSKTDQAERLFVAV